MLIYTTVHWLVSIDQQRTKDSRAYLMQAQIEIRDENYTRLDRIRFSEVGDRFDPFSLATNNPVKNSYIAPELFGGFGGSNQSFVKKSSMF